MSKEQFGKCEQMYILLQVQVKWNFYFKLKVIAFYSSRITYSKVLIGTLYHGEASPLENPFWQYIHQHKKFPTGSFSSVPKTVRIYFQLRWSTILLPNSVISLKSHGSWGWGLGRCEIPEVQCLKHTDHIVVIYIAWQQVKRSIYSTNSRRIKLLLHRVVLLRYKTLWNWRMQLLLSSWKQRLCLARYKGF